MNNYEASREIRNAVEIAIPTQPEFYGECTDEEALICAEAMADAVQDEFGVSVKLVKENVSYNNRSMCDERVEGAEQYLETIEQWIQNNWADISGKALSE